MTTSDPSIKRVSSHDDEESTTGVVATVGNVAAVVAKERADQEAKTIRTMRTLREKITKSGPQHRGKK